MSSLSLLPNWILAIYVFVFGLCTGSFLNVAVLRGLSGEDMVFARSKCPKCGNVLKWYMNIPVLSFLFLRGKCGYCREKISIQYPIVELITGISFVLLFLTFGLTIKTFLLCIVFSIFILLATTDFLETVIIDIHAYVLFVVGLIYSYFKFGGIDIIQGLIGAVFGFLFFEILSRIGILFTKCRMFGEGDSLIALGLGAIFGFKNLLIVIALSFAIQCVSAIPLLIKNCVKAKKYKLALSYFFVFLSMGLVLIVNQFSAFKESNYYLIYVLFIVSSLIWSMINIIREIKAKKELLLEAINSDEEDIESKSEFCLMPFGPALVFSGAICVFYIEQIKTFVVNFFS